MDAAHKLSAQATESDKQKALKSTFRSRLIAALRIGDVRIAFGLLTLCFTTRLIAVPASHWEWDEILFARALHQYDLLAHSPHPPGFPVFVAMARVAFWALQDEHRALTTVALIFASFLAPALFFFYREVFQDSRIALAGALLGNFAPNIWVHSVGGRSDEVALTLGIIGLTLVIRGMRSRRSLIAGCALFGLAMGVRVTLLPWMGLVIALVFIVWLRRREWKPVAAGLAAGTVCVLLWFAPFIYHVTWDIYRLAVDSHSQYTIRVDSIFADKTHENLIYRLRRFFIDIWGAKWIMHTIYGLSVLGLIALVPKRQWRVIGWMGLAFLPYIAFTLTLNVPFASPFYSLPYIPLFTGLAACGLVKTPDLIIGPEWRRTRRYLGLSLAAIVTTGLAGWTYPIIKLLHGEASPPIRAANYLKKKIAPQQDVIEFSGRLSPHANFYFPHTKLNMRGDRKNPEANLLSPVVTNGHIYGFTDHPVAGESGEEFRWTSNDYGARRLSRLSLGRYFNVYVTEIKSTSHASFLSGWSQEESDQRRTWRWMGKQSKVALLNVADLMILRLRGVAVRVPSGRRPTIVLRLNGQEIHRQTLASDDFDHSVTVKTDPRFMWYTLAIELDQTVKGIGGDTRELSFSCDLLQWTPAPGAKPSVSNPNQFLGSGWYGLEGSAPDHMRWAEPRATVRLPPIVGDGDLELVVQAPIHPDGSPSDVNITVEVSGQVVDKFRPTSANRVTKIIRIPEAVHQGKSAELVISMDKEFILPNGDNRRIGALFYYIGWKPGA